MNFGKLIMEKLCELPETERWEKPHFGTKDSGSDSCPPLFSLAGGEISLVKHGQLALGLLEKGLQLILTELGDLHRSPASHIKI